MKTSWFLVVASALLCVSLQGCGGGGGGDKPTVKNGSLGPGDVVAEDLYVDGYQCTARASGTATIRMESSDFDAFLIVGIDDSTATVVDYNDDSGPGTTDALCTFQVQRDMRYLVLATSYDSYETGRYKLTFSKEFSNVREARASASVLQGLQPQRARKTTPKH